jgi:hypothetical protein
VRLRARAALDHGADEAGQSLKRRRTIDYHVTLS